MGGGKGAWSKGNRHVLPTIITLVYVGVDVDVGDVAVEDGSRGLYHAVGELGADADGMAEER